MITIPYVKQEVRPKLDKVVEAMVKADIKADGDLNYILFKLAKYHVEPRYGNYKNFRAELLEAAEWVWWKLMVPYEKKAEEKNGDV